MKKKKIKLKKFVKSTTKAVFGPNYKQKYEDGEKKNKKLESENSEVKKENEIVKDERDSERRINETNADTLKKVNEESKK